MHSVKVVLSRVVTWERAVITIFDKLLHDLCQHFVDEMQHVSGDLASLMVSDAKPTLTRCTVASQRQLICCKSVSIMQFCDL